MPDATSLILFMTATLALNLTPGPDMLYVVTRSVGQGQKAGVISALGIRGYCLAHTAAAFGLSALLTSSAVAYAWQIIFLGLLFNVSGTLVNVVVALLGGRVGGAFKKRPAFARKQRWITGAVFIALGLRLAFAKRS